MQACDLYKNLHAAKQINPLRTPEQLMKPELEANKHPHLSLRFDGKALTLSQKENKKIIEYNFSAVSSHPNEDDSFSYDSAR